MLNKLLILSFIIFSISAKSQTDKSIDSNSNFIIWFMVSKQDMKPSKKILNKKDIIYSECKGNKLLIKTFLRKIICVNNSLI